MERAPVANHASPEQRKALPGNAPPPAVNDRLPHSPQVAFVQVDSMLAFTCSFMAVSPTSCMSCR